VETYVDLSAASVEVNTITSAVMLQPFSLACLGLVALNSQTEMHMIHWYLKSIFLYQYWPWVISFLMHVIKIIN